MLNPVTIDLAIAPSPSSPSINLQELKAILARYHQPQTVRAVWQVINSFFPFFFLWFAAFKSLSYSYGLTLLFVFLSSGFLIRIFGIQHDCGHGSFFQSKKANDSLGFICSLLTLTPYDYWLRSHAYHHAHVGNLDYRETGYVTLKTVREYHQLGPWQRWAYQLYQHPIVLLVIGPTIKFLILQRLPSQMPLDWCKERRRLHLTNSAIVLVTGGLIFLVGLKSFLLVHMPIIALTSSMGVWTFYVQHMFADTYWRSGAEWDYYTAALHSSSYYDVPDFIHWFTFYNTIHHIHHLDSRIPSYRIGDCYRENPLLQQVRKISIWESFQCANLGLWDEEQGRLIPFSALRMPIGQEL